MASLISMKNPLDVVRVGAWNSLLPPDNHSSNMTVVVTLETDRGNTYETLYWQDIFARLKQHDVKSRKQRILMQE